MKPKRHRFPTELQDDLSIYCHILRVQHKMPLKHIGKIINRDHSTVMYHIRRYEAFITYDKQFQVRMKAFSEETFSQKLLQHGIELYQNLTIN